VFLKEVGRPDLAVKTNLSEKDLAEMLYDSVQKVKKLEDNVIIYPGHGSGSSCGK
jgi:glyoxylase-like metal-dependent hydrolase (beta-lactamase superfamily II)